MVRNLKTLKSREEGGTKKEYDNYLIAIQNPVTISWEAGQNTCSIIKHSKDPTIEEPKDMTEAK